MGYKLVVGITGASGSIYAIRFLDQCRLLREKYEEVSVVYTRFSQVVFREELGVDLEEILQGNTCIDNVYREDDWDSPLASSSNLVDYEGVIIPSSMNTVAKLANSIQDNLLLRIFSSLLRLRRKVVIVFRETPLSLIDLKNLYVLARAGAIILPASPAFYEKPLKIDDLVNFIVGKVLDVLNISHNLYKRWRSDQGA